MKNSSRNSEISSAIPFKPTFQEFSTAEVKNKRKKARILLKSTCQSQSNMKINLSFGASPSSEKQTSTSSDASITKDHGFQTLTRQRRGSRKVQKQKEIQEVLYTEEGVQSVLDGLATGATVQTVSKALSIPYKELKKRLYSKDLKVRTQQAIKEGADAIVEKSQDLLTRLLPDDETDINPNKAKIVLEHYRWLAKVKNPAKYSEHQIMHVETRDLTAEHLEELRRINAARNKAENPSV